MTNPEGTNRSDEGTIEHDAAVAEDWSCFAREMALGASRLEAARRKRQQVEAARQAMSSIVDDSIALTENKGISVVVPDLSYKGQPASIYFPDFETGLGLRPDRAAQARVQISNAHRQVVVDTFLVCPREPYLLPTVQMIDYEYAGDSSHHSRYQMRRDPNGSVQLTAEAAAVTFPELPEVAATLAEARLKQTTETLPTMQ